MKSFAAVLPFMGLVVAQSLCGPRSTVTKTEVERFTVTVPAVPSHPASQTGGDEHGSTTTSSVRSTYPLHSQPSHSPMPHYPLPNGTYHNTSTSALYTAPVLSTDLPSTEPTRASTLTLLVTPSPVAATSAAAPSSVAPSLEPTAPEPLPSDTASKNAVTVSGKATSYGGNLDGGNCMFSGYTLPAGMFGTAFSGQNWDASKCGVCVSVTGPNGKSIKAMVVDKCPECDPPHLDLFANAYTAVSGQTPGIIPITYSIVPCGITSPIVLKNKSGTSPYWFSMQVMNANVGVAKLEVSTDGGKTWQATQRKDYNFFENPSGFKTATVDVKVTSVNGGVVTVNGVKVASDAKTTATANFA